MTKEIIEDQVLELLRSTALEGSRRTIAVDAPLGEQGVGLDSLGLIHFITALENTYQIEIPENFWLQASSFSVAELVDHIAKHDGFIPAELTIPVAAPAVEQVITRWEQLRRVVDRQGWPAGMRLVGTGIGRRFKRFFLAREKLFILQFDLGERAVPKMPAPPGVEFREARPEDLPATAGLWSAKSRKRKQRLFTARLAGDYSCYLAWDEGRIVAIDWVARTDDNEPKTGLQIKLNPGACYGFDLDEHPDYRGRGLGLALLAYSLQRCKELGNHTQYTIVHAQNEKMLRAAIQLFGYHQVGEVNTKRILGWKTSHWQIDNRRGSRLLEL